MRRTWLLFIVLVSVASILYSAAAVPFVIEAISKGWKPMIDLSTSSVVLTLVFIAVPATALISLRRRGKERKDRLVSSALYSAASSLIILSVVFLPILILSLLPARKGAGSSIIELTIPEEKLNQSVQSNAGSRPSSGGSPASETPSPPAPRG